MTKKQNDMLKFLSKFKSCSEEQLIFFTGGSLQDINYLVSSNLVKKDERTQLLHLKLRQVDVRTAVALDVVKSIKNDIKDIGYSKRFPIIFTVVTTDNVICDIGVIRHVEQEKVFKKFNEYTKADKVIIVLENNNYDKSLINTKKEVLICSYPVEIIDIIN